MSLPMERGSAVRPATLARSLVRPVTLIGGMALVALGAWGLGQSAYIHAKAVLAQVLIKNAWVRAQEGAIAPRPWPWADTHPVARLMVPALDIDLAVLANASGRTMAFGPTHMDRTPLPGERGVSVLVGHRDTHFTFLKDMNRGDTFDIETKQGDIRHFRIVDSRITHKDALRTPAVKDLPYVMLITCYPFDAIVPGGPLRYVVLAVETAPPRPKSGLRLSPAISLGQ